MVQHQRRNFIVYLLLTFLSGTACATFLPVMSVFLKDTVGATPFQIGAYFTLSAITGIVVTQVLAKFSDGRLSRRSLIVAGGLSGMGAGFVFIAGGLWQSYWVIAILGVLCMSFSGLSTPQVFASAREYSISHGRDSVMFTMYMRAFFALAWVIAPPLAYITAVRLGFTTLFSFTALFFCLVAVIGGLWLPATILGGGKISPKTSATSSSSKDASISDSEGLDDKDELSNTEALKSDSMSESESTSNSDSEYNSESYSIFAGGFKVWKDVALLFVAVTLMWTCNNAYLISMPIYIRDELGISEELPGVMMACAALMEIPIMLLAGKLSARFGVKTLQVISSIGGVVFYLAFSLMPQDTAWCFLAVQFFNSVFIGILAGLGMVYFQELLPRIPGQATTLFSNAANTGAIISGMIVAVVTSCGNYEHVFTVCLSLAIVALFMLFFVRRV